MTGDDDKTSEAPATEVDPVMTALDLIDGLFLETPIILEGDHAGPGAQRVIQDMPEVIRELIDFAVDQLNRSGISLPNSEALQAFYRSFRDISFSNHLSITPGAGHVIINGNIPCIRRDKLDVTKPILEGLGTNPVPSRIVARYLLARLVDSFRVAQRSAQPVPVELIFDVSVGAALLASRHFAGAERDQRHHLLQTYASIGHIDTRVARVADELAALKEQRRALQAEMITLASEPEFIRKQISEYRSEAASAVAALRAQIGLKETEKLWRNQAKQGAIAYYGSLISLIVIFVVSASLIWLFSGELVAFLGEIEGFTTDPNVPAPVVYVLAIGRLLLITGPIALLIWAAKLIVRFNLRSLLLMDDASHRVTMLDTYLFLVTKEAATIQDRGALLEAMFRRAPGHGPETVEPPNMADIMRYGDVVGGGQQRN